MVCRKSLREGRNICYPPPLSSLERWLSGRKHVPAKDAYPKRVSRVRIPLFPKTKGFVPLIGFEALLFISQTPTMALLLLLFLPLALFSKQSITITSFSELKFYLEKATKEDLVVLDIDNILLISNELVLRPCSEEFFIKQLVTLTKSLNGEQTNTLLSQVLLNRTCRCVDKEMPQLIANLQALKVKVIAITTYCPGRFGAIASIEAWRRKELQSLGFDFSKAFPRYNPIAFGDMLQDGAYPLFRDGILYTARHPKAKMLQAFLRCVKWGKDSLFIVDDNKKDVDAMLEAMESANIACCALHYQNSDIAAETFDEKVAARELHALINTSP